MPQPLILNLPSADIPRARAFYERLGYAIDDRFAGPNNVLVALSEGLHLMLLDRAMYATLTPRPLAPEGTVACNLCLPMDSREAVDALMARAVALGAVDDEQVDEHGFMYGRAFADPDGNLFAVNWMDVDAMMAAGAQGSDAA